MSKLRLKLSEQLSNATGVPVSVTSQDIILARDLSEGSKVALDFVMPYARVLAKKAGLKSSDACKEANPKRLFRLFYKAVTQYDKKVEAVPDNGRMRILFDTPEQLKNIRRCLLGENPKYDKRVGQVLDSHPTNEIKIDEVEDFYHVPSSTGRIGMHITLTVKIPGNTEIKYEIQVMHRDMVQTEDFTRDNYEKSQVIRREALAEGRNLTEHESAIVEGYDSSSRERYTADALKLGLFDLRRPDLCGIKLKRHTIEQLQLVPAA